MVLFWFGNIKIISIGLFGFYNLSGSWSWSFQYTIWSSSGNTSIYLNFSNIEKIMVIALVLLWKDYGYSTCVIITLYLCFIFNLIILAHHLCAPKIIYSFQDITGVHGNVILKINGWLTLQTLNYGLEGSVLVLSWLFPFFFNFSFCLYDIVL